MCEELIELNAYRNPFKKATFAPFHRLRILVFIIIVGILRCKDQLGVVRPTLSVATNVVEPHVVSGTDAAEVMETSQPMELRDLGNSSSTRDHDHCDRSQEQHHCITNKDDFSTTRLQLTLVNKLPVVSY
jgi:hypothetical protein